MAHSDADLELDFFADWVDLLRRELIAKGYAAPAGAQEVEIAYFNLLKRLVPIRPRAVHIAPTLSCPAEIDAGFKEVCRKIEAGEDLRPHLSRTLSNRDYNDLLLNDWGIHHLHLGLQLEADGFMQRTGPVLFVRFRDAEAYCIAVPPHGAWTDIGVLEAFAQAWPDEMKHFEMPGLALPRTGDTPSSKEIAQARRAGVQALVPVKGKYYMPMGGGLSTAGVGVAVVSAMDRHATLVRFFEDNVVREKAQIFAVAKDAHRLELQRPLRLRLRLRSDGTLFAATEDNVFGFALGPLPK